jgi:hypothetical protein
MYYFGKKVGKSLPPSDIPVPNEGNTGTDFYKKLINAIYNDIEGLTGSTEYPLYYSLYQLGDGDFAKAINYWNAKYFKQNKEKLSVAIDNEYWFNLLHNQLKTNLINKLMTFGG